MLRLAMCHPDADRMAASTTRDVPIGSDPEAEAPEAEQRNLLAAACLNSSEKKIYELLSADQPVHIDDIVERSGLNSSEVLATLFDLEMKGIVRQLPGKQFAKVLL